jgi:hypothetical protein
VIHPVTYRVDAAPARKPLRGRAAHWAAAFICFVLGVLVCHESGADSGVPLSLQVRLLGRLGTYDRHFKDRAGQIANVMVVRRKGDAESAFEQAGLVRALVELREIGGVPIRVNEAEFTDAEALARRCRTERIAVLLLTIGLETEMPRLAAALDHADILTVGTTARHAENGAVVSFSLEEARPRLVINLPRAKAQSVDFTAELLALARVIQ